MLKLSDHSKNCSKSELDLFYVPYTQTAIEGYKYVQIKPQQDWEKNEFIEFNIVGSTSYFIDIAATNIFVELECKNIEKAFPVNNILHSLFKKCEISIDNLNNEQSNNYYPYRAYIEDLLNYDEESKNTILQTQGYFKDDPTKFDNLTIAKEVEIAKDSNNMVTGLTKPQFNNGANKRKDLFTNATKTCMLKGKIHADIFSLNKLLLNGVGLSLTFHKSTNDFFFIGDGTPEYTIKNIFLQVKHVTVNESLRESIERNLKTQQAQYPLTKIQMKAIPIPASHQSVDLSISKGILPKRVVVCFVKTSAIVGNLKQNPYNFETLNIQKIELFAAGKSVPYQNGLNLKNSYIPAYNLLNTNGPLGITYKDFIGGTFIIVFDLSPDQCNGEHFNPLSDGSLSIQLEFGSVPDPAYTMITYLEYDAIMTIDINRAISYTR
jgi:hypothetical protein